MTKYRIVKREYPNGKIDYEVQKKVLGFFWWNFNNLYEIGNGIYDTLEEAEKAIEMDKQEVKETIINIK